DPLTVLERKNNDRDRLELETDEFHQKVYGGYQKILETHRDRVNFKVIDASQSLEKVFSDSLKIIEKYMEEE
ncbi:MAG: dTMP kinase, partial [Tissierellia bacterium]|nr:dTMP kinase [Tissierellia bacterium]